MTVNPIKPWYRYPLVWMLVMFPLSAVLMGAIMIWLAVDTDDGLVVDDYYKQGLEINQVLHRDEEASRLKMSATLDYDNSTRALHLYFNKGGLAAMPEQIQLKIRHATLAAKDRNVSLQRGMTNGMSAEYFAILPQALSQSTWYFEISDENWRLTRRGKVEEKLRLGFQPLPDDKHN